MPEQHDPKQDLREIIARKEVVLVVGTGVSVSATGRAPTASWQSLLLSGVDRCTSLKAELRKSGWSKRQRAAIEKGTTREKIAAADLIADELKSPAPGEFDKWLEDKVGSLRLLDRTVLDALIAFELPFTTTNYDHLVEQATGLPAVGWTESAMVEKVLRGREAGVLHLHGRFDRPESVVLGVKSYEAVKNDEHAQTVLRSLRLGKSLLFVGCADGLCDPKRGVSCEMTAWQYAASNIHSGSVAVVSSGKTGEELENTRWRSMGLDTVVGKVKLKVHQGYCPEEGWVCPTRQAWGLKPYERKTPELHARLAYTATVVGSYAEAEKLVTIWGTPVSDTSIHQCVQELGPQAQKLVMPTPVPAPWEGPFDLVLMMDGWLTRERGPDWSAGHRKKNPERVEWKEIKSAVIYRLEQRAENASGRGLLLEKYVVATPPDTNPLDFGQAVRDEAMRRGLARAKTVYLVMDGAVWLWDLAEDRFKLAVKTLDFHHAREHLNTIAEALYGIGTIGTQRAKDWLAQQVESAPRRGSPRGQPA